MAPRGRSIAEIRAAMIPRRVDAAGEPPAAATSSIETALAQRERMTATSLLTSGAAEVETAARAGALEQELRLEKTNIELEEVKERREQLRHSRAPGADRDGAMLDTVLSLLERDRQTLAEQNAALNKQLLDQLNLQVRELKDEFVGALTSGNGNGNGGTPPVRDLLGEMRALKETYEALYPPAAAGASIGDDLDRMLKMHQIQEAHEERMARISRENLREDRTMELAERAASADERRSEMLTNTVAQALPTLQKFATEVGSRVLENNGGSQIAAAATAPSDIAPPVAPGGRLATCPTPECRQAVAFAPGYDTATCPNCGLELQLSPPELPAAEPEPELAGAHG